MVGDGGGYFMILLKTIWVNNVIKKIFEYNV